MDLSFFPDQEQIVSPLGSKIGKAVEPNVEVVGEKDLAEATREVAGEQAVADEARELAFEARQEVAEAAEEVARPETV